MRAVHGLWFGEMPRPVTAKDATGAVATARRSLALRLAVCAPQHERVWGDDVAAIPGALAAYLEVLDAQDNDGPTLDADFTWEHACVASLPLMSWRDRDHAFVVLCLGFLTALEAEEKSHVEDDAHAVTERWRRAAGYFGDVSLATLPHAGLWQQLAVVAAHASELRNVEAEETSKVQLARYHSAVSRSAFSACVAASEAVDALPPAVPLSQQLRWHVNAAKVACRNTYWKSEAVVFADAHQPQLALVFTDAVSKTKLPIPPQYSHRACRAFTALMHNTVSAHQELLQWALEEKSRLQAAVQAPPLAHDQLTRFLSIAPLSLTSLQPLLESTMFQPRGGNQTDAKIPIKGQFESANRDEAWTLALAPSLSPNVLRNVHSVPSLTPRTMLRPSTSMLELALPSCTNDPYHCHRSLSVFKRKACGLCERAFPAGNLPGEVVRRRILELRVFWGVESEKNPKHAPASFLYHTVRVCLLCHDILSAPPTAGAKHALATEASITTHVGRLRKHSVLTTAAKMDEIGYMIHESILNDALLLLEAPGHLHRRRDITQRPNVRATMSTSLLLGVAANAIDRSATRGIHTQEELAPWWEVDLGTHCSISSVEIWNCVDSDPCVAECLFPCHIVLLMKPGHGRDLLTLTALGVDSTVIHSVVQPVRWEPKAGSVARYVRVVVNKWTYLHVERIHVFGSPVQQEADMLKKKRPSSTGTSSKLRLLRHDPTSVFSRPKSAGFLVPTASSHVRSQIGHEIRAQLDAERA